MLTILGLVLVVVSTILIYRSAKQNGHNAILWTAISALAGVGLQLIIPIIAGIIIAAFGISAGKSLAQIQDEMIGPGIVIGIICLILNIVVVILIIKKISLIAEEKPVTPPPPPPPNFNQNQ